MEATANRSSATRSTWNAHSSPGWKPLIVIFWHQTALGTHPKLWGNVCPSAAFRLLRRVRHPAQFASLPRARRGGAGPRSGPASAAGASVAPPLDENCCVTLQRPVEVGQTKDGAECEPPSDKGENRPTSTATPCHADCRYQKEREN
jgi:hypothetical protein